MAARYLHVLIPSFLHAWGKTSDFDSALGPTKVADAGQREAAAGMARIRLFRYSVDIPLPFLYP